MPHAMLRLASRLPVGTRNSTHAPGSWRLDPRNYSTHSTEPLRILFCGSDDFSITSLEALEKARRQIPNFIDSIHVVHRPPKPTGRGLKTLREVPIAAAAAHLALPTHPLNTFTNYTPSFPYSLIIAVSFGLLIPARILRAASHGGLNIHPSLLPDLPGPAPIQHAILQQKTHTGVTLQTLHPTRFDAGTILAQTPAPGIEIGKHETTASLHARLAPIGAQMLLDVLKRRFAHEQQTREIQPSYDVLKNLAHPEEQSCENPPHQHPLSHAPKITKSHSFIDFSTMPMSAILATHRALGDTWCLLPNGERLLMHALADAHTLDVSAPPGLAPDDKIPGRLLFRDKEGRLGVVGQSTYPGGKRGAGNAKVAKMLRDAAA